MQRTCSYSILVYLHDIQSLQELLLFPYSTIEHYSSVADGFNGMGLLKALLDFLKIFLGAFALGSAMGMLNALVSYILCEVAL